MLHHVLDGGVEKPDGAPASEHFRKTLCVCLLKRVYFLASVPLQPAVPGQLARQSVPNDPVETDGDSEIEFQRFRGKLAQETRESYDAKARAHRNRILDRIQGRPVR